MTSIDDDAEPTSRAGWHSGLDEGESAIPTHRWASARDAAPEDGPHPYFMQIEDLLLRLRARATIVPPADYQLAKKWFLAGVPLALIERTLEELFVQRAQAGKDGIVSLRLARRKVEKAWDDLCKLQAPSAGRPQEDPAAGEEEGDNPLQRLEALAARLPADLVDRERWGARIVGLAAVDDLAEIENGLAALEERLLEAVESALDAKARESLQERLDAALEPMGERLSAAQRQRAEIRLRHRLLRKDRKLPPFSLFAG